MTAARDRELLVSIASSMDEAIRRSGEWVVCRPGCTQCCLGPFAITPLDAWRLGQGMAALASDRAETVRGRARAYLAEHTGNADDDAMDEVPCPALDPATGLCDLYEWRPVTCRTFGPATRVDDGVGACELCYEGATEEQVAACAVDVDADEMEPELVREIGGEATTVAYALVGR